MSFERVVNILAHFIKIHKQMNELAIEKTEIIKKNDMPALDELIKKEASLIKQLKKLEQDRKKTVSEYARKYGLTSENVTISELVESVPEKERAILKKLQKGLLSEIGQLKKQNELNGQLLEDSLRYINFTLDLIVPDPEEYMYRRPSGKQSDEGTHRSIFDSRA